MDEWINRFLNVFHSLTAGKEINVSKAINPVKHPPKKTNNNNNLITSTTTTADKFLCTDPPPDGSNG